MTINPHPELPEFDYIRPASLVEASQFLAQHAGHARPLSGGTDIFVRMRDRVWRDQYLVDIKHFDGTHDLTYTSAGLTIGAGVSMNRIIVSPEVQQHYPLLAQACRRVASYQLRTRATVVGNICNASPAGDSIGACIAFGGVLKVHGLNGFRDEPLQGFFLAPGKTRLQPGDIVTALHLPPPPPGSQGTYIKIGRNTWGDLAIVGVTVLAYPDPAAKSGYRFRILLASVAPTPLEASAAQDYLAAHPLGESTFKEAARLAAQACNPIDDVRGSARYRKAMVRKQTEIALLQVGSKLAR